MFGNYLGVRVDKDEGKRMRGQAPAGRYTKATTSGPKASADVRCQKCLKLGHYSYECTANTVAYKARPTRTQQLLNPKKQRDGPSVSVPAEFGGSGQAVTSSAPLAIKAGLADKILADKEKARKKKRREESSSDSDSDSDSSSSESDSESDSDSDSSSSSSTSSTDAKRKGKRTRRSASPARRNGDKGRSRSQTPPKKRDRDSRSD